MLFLADWSSGRLKDRITHRLQGAPQAQAVAGRPGRDSPNPIQGRFIFVSSYLWRSYSLRHWLRRRLSNRTIFHILYKPFYNLYEPFEIKYLPERELRGIALGIAGESPGNRLRNRFCNVVRCFSSDDVEYLLFCYLQIVE